MFRLGANTPIYRMKREDMINRNSTSVTRGAAAVCTIDALRKVFYPSAQAAFLRRL